MFVCQSCDSVPFHKVHCGCTNFAAGEVLNSSLIEDLTRDSYDSPVGSIRLSILLVSVKCGGSFQSSKLLAAVSI